MCAPTCLCNNTFIFIFYDKNRFTKYQLGSDSLSNVYSSSFVDEKNVVGRWDPTKGVQPGSPMEISHLRSRWIIRTNNMVTKKNEYANKEFCKRRIFNYFFQKEIFKRRKFNCFIQIRNFVNERNLITLPKQEILQLKKIQWK